MEKDLHTIIVNGKEFNCEKEFGSEYSHISSDWKGLPIQPYLFQRDIDEYHAWLLDAEYIFWILETDWHLDDPVSYFNRPCQKACLDYIVSHDPVFNDYDKVFRLKHALQGKNWDEIKNKGEVE